MGASIQTMKIFVRAAETTSFTAVARSMLIDRAAVSRAIKGLETEFDVLLFARSTRALKLTAEGARFYRDCVQVLKKFEAATQRFRRDDAAPRGRLNVGMGSGLPRRMLLRAIPQWRNSAVPPPARRWVIVTTASAPPLLTRSYGLGPFPQRNPSPAMIAERLRPPTVALQSLDPSHDAVAI